MCRYDRFSQVGHKCPSVADDQLKDFCDKLLPLASVTSEQNYQVKRIVAWCHKQCQLATGAPFHTLDKMGNSLLCCAGFLSGGRGGAFTPLGSALPPLNQFEYLKIYKASHAMHNKC